MIIKLNSNITPLPSKRHLINTITFILAAFYYLVTPVLIGFPSIVESSSIYDSEVDGKVIGGNSLPTYSVSKDIDLVSIINTNSVVDIKSISEVGRSIVPSGDTINSMPNVSAKTGKEDGTTDNNVIINNDFDYWHILIIFLCLWPLLFDIDAKDCGKPRSKPNASNEGLAVAG